MTELPVEGKGHGPGLLDRMVLPQGGSIHADVRVCGERRVMVLDRC